MEIFDLHNEIMNDYKSYIKSFVMIQDEDIAKRVEDSFDSDKLFPDPLIQFNPSFKKHGDINSLVEDNTLELELKYIFKGFNLYKHQVDAIKLGSSGEDFVVTSGTGSGKSLTYIASIFNHLFKNKNLLGRGIKAIIVYPMNALINSQTKELNKYKKQYQNETGKDFPITFGQYTGQENQEIRVKIRENPPDIILTNYMMLELLLSRETDIKIKDSLYNNLQYLVFDELHTYRGCQGADVSMLIRRIKSKCKNNNILCIGTSATMVASKDSIEGQKKEVAGVAESIFGKPFSTKQIINETLETSFSKDLTPPTKEELNKSIFSVINSSDNELALLKNKTAQWLERNIALDTKDEVLIRRKPMTFEDIVKKLSEDTGSDKKLCSKHLQELLKWISDLNIKLNTKNISYLPFKLHQFISQTGSVYITLEEKGKRVITLFRSKKSRRYICSARLLL